jgi:uncharacterized protein
LPPIIRQTPGVRYRARVSRTTWLAIALLLLGAFAARAAEVMPPKPAGYFNDAAGVVSREAALRFNEQLAQFERETSNQLVVAVYPQMETDSSIEDYTQRIAQSWGVGQADRRNGAVLFVFVQDRKMFIQVGYGLEGTLPDVTAFDITERNVKPRFRTNDYEGGLATGIDLMMKAARGEYTGSGKTVLERKERNGAEVSGCSIPILLFIFVIIMMSFMGSRKRARRGWGYSGGGGPFIFGGGGGGWGGGGGGGWSGGGGGGGFSGFGGGGGSFGGGGAGSDW